MNVEAPVAAQGFGRRYQANQPWAVRNLSTTIRAGSIVALVGPNGSGKSTFIRACLGFEVPDEGRILVSGADPQRDRVAALSSLAYVAQATFLYRSLTIRDHFTIASAARPSFDRDFAKQRMEAAALSEARKVGQLSGGEQVQVALALALGTRAPILLLDEPLANLDPLARREFLAAMTKDVRQRGATAIVSSHLISDVEQICDALIVLVDGNLALEATVVAAKQQFRVCNAGEAPYGDVVGAFLGPNGESLALVRRDNLGRQATLEEVVLGHLASKRRRIAATAT